MTSPASAAYGPLCGCSGETYWNAALAIKAGAAIQIQGECGVEAGHECGMPGMATCVASFGSGAYCSAALSAATACPIGGTAMPVATCWVMPPLTCEMTEGGHACGSLTTCQSACALIEGGQPWVHSSCAP